MVTRYMKDSEEIARRCRYLESLGFKINHIDEAVEMNGHIYDFSATKMEPVAIISTVINETYKYGVENGKTELQESLKDLLGIGNN